MAEEFAHTLIPVRQAHHVALDVHNEAVKDFFGINPYFSQFLFFHFRSPVYFCTRPGLILTQRRKTRKAYPISMITKKQPTFMKKALAFLIPVCYYM